MKKDEKASEWIKSHTKELNGKPYIEAVECLIELYARIMAIQGGIKNIHEALSDYGKYAIDMDKRMSELEGKKTIEVVSPDQAKIILLK